jgi:hypothetical protein
MNKIIYRTISFMTACVLALGSHYNAQASTMSGAMQSVNQNTMLTTNSYYVGTTGSDTNPGTVTLPFKTFAKAVSSLTAGSTLQVMAGTYTETLTLSTSGTASAPITVIGNGDIVNMQGSKANGIVVSGSYVNLSGFEAMGATDFGILITGKNVIVKNNIVHDNVTRNGVGTCGLSTTWGSALKVKVGGENTIIRNNTVYDNCGEGIAVTRGVVALVENNTVYDNFGVNIYVDNSPFVTVQNNFSYCTGTHLRDGKTATGIALGEEFYTGWGAQLHDTLISGNTITNCRTGIAVFESNVGGTLTNVTITNNSVPSGQVRSISLQTLTNQNIVVSYNTVFNALYVFQSTGVTLTGNIIGSATPAVTNTALPTQTTPAPSFTPTSISTATPLPASPTAALPTTPPTATLISSTPAIVPTSIPPTATVAATNPPTLETIYDDKNGGFVYSAGWEDVNKKQAYNRSFKSTSQNGAQVSFSFIGQSFSVLYKGGSSFRKMDVYVDDVLVGTIDEKTSSSTFQVRWDYPGQLDQGAHTLKLVFVTPNTSGGTNGSIDAVIIR